MKTKLLYLDLETFCETPINVGTHKYCVAVEITVFAYALDDGPVTVWDRTDGSGIPADLAGALAGSCTIIAHNSAFDRNVMQHTGYPTDLKRWRCTMAQALAHGLPGSLDKLGEVLGIDEDKKKLKDGHALVLLFCKPRPKNSKFIRATRETHPVEWARFLQYAGNDIEALRAIHKKLPKWNYGEASHELALWHLDQTVNNRGIQIDLALAHAAINSAGRIKDLMADRTFELTDGDVGAATQRDALIKHILEAHGIEIPDMTKAAVQSLLDSKTIDLPEIVRELLEIRLCASRNSTAKFAALIKATSSDGRLRGTLQFCGASRTGRWAGRIVQPQNFSRVPKYLKKQYDFAVEAIKADAVELIYDNPMEVLGACIRGALVAPEGKKFCISDLSNIEGRVLAWAAGESWKIKAFRDFDLGIGWDLYKLAYAKSFGIPVEQVDDGDMRQIGKVLELSMGYAGGVGAFVTFAAAYGIDLDDMSRKAWSAIPPEIIREATSGWEWAEKTDRTYGLPKQTWIVCDSFKRLWRYAHPEIVAFWAEVEQAAKSAIAHEGTVFEARTVKFVKQKAWLRMVLPSTRSVCYPGARVDDNQLSYLGINQFSRKWSRLKTYSGKLVENAIQAIARDVMAHNMPAMEKAGYLQLISIHDEIICETPDTDDFSHKALSGILSTVPPWAHGLPLAAAGMETFRYRKE